MIGGDKIYKPGFDHWHHRVFVRCHRHLRKRGLQQLQLSRCFGYLRQWLAELGSPIIHFHLCKQIACFRKGWLPYAPIEVSVPTDMIKMQVCAKHKINSIRTIPGLLKRLQELALLLMPVFRQDPFLVVANTGINDQRGVGRLDNKCLNQTQHHTIVIDITGSEPVDRFDYLRRRPWYQHLNIKEFLLDY